VEDDSNTFQEYHQEEERFHGNLLQHISLYCVFSSKTLLYPKGTEPVKTGKPTVQTILLVWNLFFLKKNPIKTTPFMTQYFFKKYTSEN
jgi:hypothetical protein